MTTSMFDGLAPLLKCFGGNRKATPKQACLPLKKNEKKLRPVVNRTKDPSRNKTLLVFLPLHCESAKC